MGEEEAGRVQSVGSLCRCRSFSQTLALFLVGLSVYSMKRVECFARRAMSLERCSFCCFFSFFFPPAALQGCGDVEMVAYAYVKDGMQRKADRREEFVESEQEWVSE